MSARRQFLAECGKAIASLVFMQACEQEKLLAPVCEAVIPHIDEPTVSGDVYIVDGFTGSQEGTRDNPYSVRDAPEFDALLQFLRPQDFLAVHKEGRFKTAGVYRWGQYASRNLGRGWTVDGDYELAIDPDSVTAQDAQPLYCLAGPASRVSGAVRGNHSALADRWTGSLRTGGVLLEGDGSIDNVTFKDFGSLGAETFVAVAAVITNCRATDFAPGASDTQVSVWFTGDKRAFALHEGNEILASSDVWVQGHTIYDALVGVVRGNRTVGARTGYYGDYWVSKNRVIEGNRFLGCEHGIQLQLSPTPESLAWNFSHEDYEIGWNKIESSGANVSLNTYGPSTDTRFIRNIRVHPSLSLENYGATDVRREAVCRMAA